MLLSLKPQGFFPTASRAGTPSAAIFRGANGFIRGSGQDKSFQSYRGSLDLNESTPPVALTGSITCSVGSRVVTGTGTNFFEELRRGMMLVTLAGNVLVVEEVTSATAFTACELPTATETTVSAFRMPILFEVNNRRGTLLSGRAHEFDRGHIVAVGSGVLRLNGTALSASLTATRNARIALFNQPTGAYEIKTLGFNDPPIGITATESAAAVVRTFVDADVTAATDTIAITGHGFVNGQRVGLTTTGALPAGLAVNATYYVIRVDANNIRLATTLARTVGTPVPVDITAAAGGGTHTVTPISKKMAAGNYGLRISRATTKLGVPAFGNPGEKIIVALTTYGSIIAITFPAMDSHTDSLSLHDAWRVECSLHTGLAGQAGINAEAGPWYFAVTVSAADLGGTGGGTYFLEVLDAELTARAQITSFDNDTPPRAEFITTLAQVPILVSCNGKGTPASPLGDAPGASIVPLKMSNLAAAPLVFDNGQRNEIPLSPPEVIIGCYSAAGRLYLMTPNTLQIAAFTENPFQPISTRPFWKSGFRNPYALCFANDRLYGFTNSPIRSPEDGTDAATDRGFASPVRELTYFWNGARVYVAHDPANEAVCYVYSAAYKNANGYWVSVILPYMVENEVWSPPIILSSATRDCIVSGVATINNNFEFLMGGRDGAGSVYCKAFRFDGGLNAGETVPWYFAFQFSDGGQEDRPKKVKFPRITYKGKSMTLGIHGAARDETINVATLEAGNSGSKTGSVTVPNATALTSGDRLQVEAGNLAVFTVRVDGVYDGAETDAFGLVIRDRVDEVVLDVTVQGGRN